jgi:hypothetical protein
MESTVPTQQATGLDSLRIARVMEAARRAGLAGGEKDTRIGGRVSHALIEQAKARTSIQSDTELLEYALAKVAIEDDFTEYLISRKGSVDPELDLEF